MKIRSWLRVRLLPLLGVLLLVVLAVGTAWPSKAAAAQITSRSLLLQAGPGPNFDGGSKVSGLVDHQFTFTISAHANLGSIQFQYCTTADPLSCIAPSGLDTSAATLGTSTGATFTSAVSSAANVIYVSRVAASFGGGSVTQQLLGVTNPDATDCPANVLAPSCTFYVRITTYASTNATGSPIDTGVVAASVNEQILLTGTMPESLVFCTGATVSTTSGVPDCATATSGAVGFNQLFSPTDTATATSQMAASTNAGFGYSITVNGATLTSGANTISAMTTTGTGDLGVRGTGQFGLNLKANTTTTSTPAVGTEVAPAANGTNFRGQAVTGYNSVDHFRFVTGEGVADSANGGAGGTDAQIFSVSYVVNVPGSQPAGTYTSTLTYICTPTF